MPVPAAHLLALLLPRGRVLQAQEPEGLVAQL